MASPPPPPAAAAALKDCWGCRLVCGAGLLGAGGYVLAAARQVMKSRAAPPGMGTVAQIVFGVGLASWGVVVLVDPVNNIRDANTPIAGRGQDV